MLQRSLSLIRRYPSPESIDLTFATAEVEERMRIWANKNLTIKYVPPTDPTPERERHRGTIRGGLPPDSLQRSLLSPFFNPVRMTLLC